MEAETCDALIAVTGEQKCSRLSIAGTIHIATGDVFIAGPASVRKKDHDLPSSAFTVFFARFASFLFGFLGLFRFLANCQRQKQQAFLPWLRALCIVDEPPRPQANR